MTDRITTAQLKRQLALLNLNENGTRDDRATGSYHIESAYGGVKLCQLLESGGSSEITPWRLTKRELYQVIYTMNEVAFRKQAEARTKKWLERKELEEQLAVASGVTA